MTSKQINFEGNLEKVFNKNYKKKFFSRLFHEFKDDIKNPNKTLNILDVSKSGILAVSTDGINWNNLKIQGVSFENFN